MRHLLRNKIQKLNHGGHGEHGANLVVFRLASLGFYDLGFLRVLCALGNKFQTFPTDYIRVVVCVSALGCFLLGVTPAAATEVSVLGLFKDRAVLMVDGQRRVLTVGQTSPEGVKLIGADAEGATLEIDGKKSRHQLGSDIGASYTPPAETVVKLWPDGAGMYTVSGAINGLTVSFLVDTGATNVSMSSTEARRLGINYRMKGERGAVETASGVVRAYGVKLDTVRVGEIQLHNVDAVVLEGNSPSQILLGMSFLSRVHMEREGAAMLLRKTY